MAAHVSPAWNFLSIRSRKKHPGINTIVSVFDYFRDSQTQTEVVEGEDFDWDLSDKKDSETQVQTIHRVQVHCLHDKYPMVMVSISLIMLFTYIFIMLMA